MDTPAPEKKPAQHHLRFHLPHTHLATAFGDDWFALKAEAFARFFGTPVFPHWPDLHRRRMDGLQHPGRLQGLAL